MQAPFSEILMQHLNRITDPQAIMKTVLVLTGLIATGCPTPGTDSEEREQSNLKPLAILYGRFTGQHRGQPPANEEEFKEFIKSLSSQELEQLPGNPTDADSLFISSRDNKPYKVIYGSPMGPPGPAGAPVIAYEQEGLDGTRFVASDLGAVEEVDDARFKELVPNAE